MPAGFRASCGLVGALLEFVLEFFLLLLEHLGIDRRALIGLDEAVAGIVRQRQRQAESGGGEIDGLDDEYLALLELADQVGVPSNSAMQPLGKQVKKAPVNAGSLSMTMRAP